VSKVKGISLTRFKWKPPSWMRPDNILSLWITCKNNVISYEFELNPNLELSDELLIRTSRKKSQNAPKFIRITDRKIIDTIENNLSKFDVCGAKGRGIIIGEIIIPLADESKKILVLSTLKYWRCGLSDKIKKIRLKTVKN
jgi:hypothetical protein